MLLHIPQTALINLSRLSDGSNDTATFAQDVVSGLSKPQKQLSSRYFYDAAGSRLFQQIMDLPEYYLTRAEFEVITNNRQTMASTIASQGSFHLIDLGAGDALKTKILLREMLQQNHKFDYVPIDISGDAMLQLTDSLHHEMPDLQVHAIVGEYIQALEWLQNNKPEPKVVLFLGSNIGNFEPAESMNFLHLIRKSLNPGDKLLLGIDLRKDPDTVLKAYDDAAGVTAAFNLNLLVRINRELGGNFDLDQFRHFANYDPLEGVMKSYLVSKIKQDVYLAKVGKRFSFEAWEAIHTENSHKYSITQVQEMGQSCDFEIEAVFQDQRQYFADVLFKVV